MGLENATITVTIELAWLKADLTPFAIEGLIHAGLEECGYDASDLINVTQIEEV